MGRLDLSDVQDHIYLGNNGLYVTLRLDRSIGKQFCIRSISLIQKQTFAVPIEVSKIKRQSGRYTTKAMTVNMTAREKLPFVADFPQIQENAKNENMEVGRFNMHKPGNWQWRAEKEVLVSKKRNNLCFVHT